MGDWCYLEIVMRKGDLGRATEVIGKCWEKEYECPYEPGMEWYDGMVNLDEELVKLVIYEAKYAMVSELQALAKEKIDFDYFHGAGEAYGPCVGVCLNGELLECNADVDGNPVAVVVKENEVPWGEIRRCWKYYSMVTEFYGE